MSAACQKVPPCDQRFWELQEQVVDVVALLGTHLQRVAKALCRQKPDAAAASFDDRVGDERRAVHDMADIGDRDCQPC